MRGVVVSKLYAERAKLMAAAQRTDADAVGLVLAMTSRGMVSLHVNVSGGETMKWARRIKRYIIHVLSFMVKSRFHITPCRVLTIMSYDFQMRDIDLYHKSVLHQIPIKFYGVHRISFY